MRLFVLFLFSVNLIFASTDILLLKAQATIFPKIIMLDKDIQWKCNDNKLVLAIVHTKQESDDAEKLRSMIDAQYKNKLGAFSFEVRLIDIDQFNVNEEVSAYYIFDASLPSMKNVISHAIDKKCICFGYSYKDFSNNILISLFVKEKTYIYLNRSALHEYKIKFIPIFYKISKAR